MPPAGFLFYFLAGRMPVHETRTPTEWGEGASCQFSNTNRGTDEPPKLHPGGMMPLAEIQGAIAMDWMDFFKTFGFPAALSILLIYGAYQLLWRGGYWVAENAVMPMVRSHISLMQTLERAVQEDTRNLGAITQTQAKIVERLDIGSDVLKGAKGDKGDKGEKGDRG